MWPFKRNEAVRSLATNKMKWDLTEHLYPCEFRSVIHHYWDGDDAYVGKCDLLSQIRRKDGKRIFCEECSTCTARLGFRRVTIKEYYPEIDEGGST